MSEVSKAEELLMAMGTGQLWEVQVNIPKIPEKVRVEVLAPIKKYPCHRRGQPPVSGVKCLFPDQTERVILPTMLLGGIRVDTAF